ncbi:MAG: 50S ribosomal protein L6 [Planctomycetes bacterium]|nr:50S ribosomal protein L6 [Planctomycetota bacterium]
MSRLGKVPVSIPSGVKLASDTAAITITGPKGTLKFPLHNSLKVEVTGAIAKVSRSGDTRESKSHHGLTRAMIANMVRGVSEGYERRLEISGVGWGAKIEGKDIVVTIGFCHPARVTIPQGVTVECPQPTHVVIKGIDRHIVGQLAAKIRKIRPPEPYNAKGIKYAEETIKRKQGKSFGTT